MITIRTIAIAMAISPAVASSPAPATAQGRAVPLGLPRERRLLRTDQRPRAERGAQARAVPEQLDAERGLLRGDAAALTCRPSAPLETR
jgi:hypothetical protein